MDWLINVLIEILCPALGLIILAGLLVYWILKKKLLRENSLKLIAYIFSAAIIFQSFFSTILNWWLWSKQGITQRLLPPHSSIAYVLKYSWQHYWFEPVIVIFAAIIVFFSIYFLNKRFENQLFYNEEKYLAALGILATGWPNCLIYFSSVLVLGILFHFLFLCFNFNKRRRRGDVAEKTVAQADLPAVARRAKAGRRVEENISRVPFRLSLLYFWLPCALLVLFLNGIISKYLIINQFII